MKGMILAAGLGTRLLPYTRSFAKPALPFLNVPLLYYPFYLLEKAGVSEFVVNTSYLPHQIQDLARKVPGFAGKVHISHEEGDPLGSGGGIKKAAQWLQGHGDFFVANGDEVILPSSWDVFPKLRAQHVQNQALATILVMRHPLVGKQFGGVWTDPTGRVHGFGKQKPDGHRDLEGLHYIGILLLNNRVFEYLPEGESNLLYDALLSGMRAGEVVQTVVDDCEWFETGNAPDFLQATETYLTRTVSSPGHRLLEPFFQRFWPNSDRRPSFWEGVGSLNRMAPGQGRVLLGNDCRVEEGTVVKGFLVAGDGARIGRNCTLENVIVLPGASIRDGVSIQNQLILPRTSRD